MRRVEAPVAVLQRRVSTARLARASAIVPLVLVLPMAAFLMFVMNSEHFSKMPAGIGPAIFTSFVLPVYIGIAVGYFALAVLLTSLGVLTLRSMLLASAALSVAIGGLYVLWSEESSARELVEAFALGTGFHVPIWCTISWLWWRLARGTNQKSLPTAAANSEA